MTTAFEAEVGRLMTRFNSPGLSVDMLTGGKRHSAHMGHLVEGLPHKITREARYASVCLIKLLIAIELLMLAEKGTVSLDAPVANYLPELAQGPKAKGKIIMLRHLLSHTFETLHEKDCDALIWPPRIFRTPPAYRAYSVSPIHLFVTEGPRSTAIDFKMNSDLLSGEDQNAIVQGFFRSLGSSPCDTLGS